MGLFINPDASLANGNNLIDDDDDDDDDYQVELLPPRGFEKLICGDNVYDLRNKDEATEARLETAEARQQLRDGQLVSWEGKSTDFGEGGRSRLLYDEVRAQMAVDKFDGKHEMTYQQMHEEAQQIVALRAQQARARDINFSK